MKLDHFSRHSWHYLAVHHCLKTLTKRPCPLQHPPHQLLKCPKNQNKKTFFLTSNSPRAYEQTFPLSNSFVPFSSCFFFQNNDAVRPSAYQNTCQVLVPKELPLSVVQGMSPISRFFTFGFHLLLLTALLREFDCFAALLLSVFNWATWVWFQRFGAFKVFYLFQLKTRYSGWCWSQYI